MKPFCVVGPIALVFGGLGCAPLQSRITGVFSPVAGKYAPGEFTDVRVDGQSLYPELRPYQRIETEQMVKIRVSEMARGHDDRRNFNYSVLLGPVPGSRRTAEGWLKHSEPVFFLQSGALFMWGQNPLAESEWVSAASKGSTIVIQTIEDQNLERVFFLTGGSITVWPKLGPGAPKTWTQTNTYIEYGPDLNFGEVRTIPNTGDICAFVHNIAVVARKAGWTEAVPPVCVGSVAPDPDPDPE